MDLSRVLTFKEGLVVGALSSDVVDVLLSRRYRLIFVIISTVSTVNILQFLGEHNSERDNHSETANVDYGCDNATSLAAACLLGVVVILGSWRSGPAVHHEW